jgi:hypothetical protein
MSRRHLLFAFLSLLGVLCATLPAFMYYSAAGLPFNTTRTAAGELMVAPLPGVELPSGLKSGDVIAWQAMGTEARAAVNTVLATQALKAGGTYTLHIRRDGNQLTVPVTSVSLTGSPGVLNNLVYITVSNLLLLALVLLTLWRGRDWAAWGLSLYAFCWLLGSSAQIIPGTPYLDLVLLLVIDFTLNLSSLGLYITAESLAGPVLGRCLRWVFRFMFVILFSSVLILSLPRTIGAVFFGWQVGAWYGAMMICATAQVFLVMVVLVAGYLRAPDAARLRLRWILMATILLLVTMLLNYFTPIMFSLSGILFLDLLWALVFACYVYGVLRHRLVNLSFVIDRTLVYGATTTLVIGVLSAVNALAQHAALGHSTSLILEVVVPLALGIVLGTVRKRVDAWVDRLFFRRKYKADKALRAFAERCAFIEQETTILDRSIQELKRNTGTPGIAVYERTPQGYRSLRQLPAGTYPASVGTDDPILVALRAGHKEAELLESDSALGHDGYAFPMTIRGVLIGVVVVAPRPAEQYTGEERELIAHVVHEVGIALFAARARNQSEFLRESLSDNSLPESWRARARQLMSVV